MNKKEIIDAVRACTEWTIEDLVSLEQIAKDLRRGTVRARRDLIPVGPRNVHTEHCCLTHGCKYSDPKCPVATGNNRQSYDCEECGLEDEGYFD